MASVTIVFRKNKVNKNGEAPIFFRVIKNRKSSYISTGFSVNESDWDESNKRIKSTAKGKEHKETVARMNAVISKRFTEIQNELIEVESTQKSITTKTIRETLHGKPPLDFYQFADSVVENYGYENKPGTHSRTKSVVAKLRAYAPNLQFGDITPKFLADYEKHLKTKKKQPNSINTIHANFKFIRLLFNKAYQQDLIDYSINPFLKYKVKTEKTNKEYLTEDELELFRNAETETKSNLDLHKNMFIFAAYTGGLRVSDVLQLQWKHFDGTNINFTIKKTKGQLSIKVPIKALEILEKYRPEYVNQNAFIFKMLPEGILNKSAKDLDTEISRSTAIINKNLKTIAGLAEIEKNISFHISRHTWATRALRKGISIDKVSKLMGHAAIKETQVYAKIINSELDNAMDVFNL